MSSHGDHTSVTACVVEWTKKVPILYCPWAAKSFRQNRIRFQECVFQDPSHIEAVLQEEARLLLEQEKDNGEDIEKNHVFPTSLLICPNVPEWNASFEAFDEFLRDLRRKHREEQTFLHHEITLVAFHPNFVRWRGLPPGIIIGSPVLAYKQAVGGCFSQKKSFHPYPATIVETTTRVFGRRKIKVQFVQNDDDGGVQTQYIPVEWCVFDDDDHKDAACAPLPDNAMHQSPLPCIHLIRNCDLARLRARDVSKIKRTNAQRMASLPADFSFSKQDA